MFLEYAVDITNFILEENYCYIRFFSLKKHLSNRKIKRPKWRTNLVKDQQIRCVRTTLLGRMPGWSNFNKIIGPWKPIELISYDLLKVEESLVNAGVHNSNGYINYFFKIKLYKEINIKSCCLFIGDYSTDIQHSYADEFVTLQGFIEITNVLLWWPHGYGQQTLYSVQLELEFLEGTRVKIDCGQIGFRTVELLNSDSAPQDFGFIINDEIIFCKGACWTIPTELRFKSFKHVEQMLELACKAGINMFRVSGTMVYETEEFYSICDKLGILIWQDFMFANMDYPFSDDRFLDCAVDEFNQILRKLVMHPCLALLCGGSEVEQQAAMLGLSTNHWSSKVFEEILPSICKKIIPQVPYWNSSPSKGIFPFHVDSGDSHYYGIEAYRRSFEDPIIANVRFASECLAFSNIPEDETIESFIDYKELAVHHPLWKLGVPRDSGSGWDFEDIRDYYLNMIFDIDPFQLRASEMDRYIELSRITSGEAMYRLFSAWRRRKSFCNGGLIWFYRDLIPGSGWGIIDSLGNPKAPYYFLKRIFSSIAVFFFDEGLNGLLLYVSNESPYTISARIEVMLYRYDGILISQVEKKIIILEKNELEVNVEGLFGRFFDSNYSYRFGKRNIDFVFVRLVDMSPEFCIGRAFYFCEKLLSSRNYISLTAVAKKSKNNSYELTLSNTKLFIQSIAIKVKGFIPEDNFFHIEPGGVRTIMLEQKPGNSDIPHGTVKPANSYEPIEIKFT